MSAAILAEFENAEVLIKAIEAMKSDGLTEMDANSPYPSHAIEDALGLKRSFIPKIMAAVGLSAAAGAYALQYYFNAYDYPINTGGRPPHFAPGFLIVTFEMGILFAAITALVSTIILSGLPRLWHPFDEIEGFDRALVDRFFLILDDKDPKLDLAKAEARLKELGALRVSHPRKED
jgi:hypothetical protein